MPSCPRRIMVCSPENRGRAGRPRRFPCALHFFICSLDFCFHPLCNVIVARPPKAMHLPPHRARPVVPPGCDSPATSQASTQRRPSRGSRMATCSSRLRPRLPPWPKPRRPRSHWHPCHRRRSGDRDNQARLPSGTRLPQTVKPLATPQRCSSTAPGMRSMRWPFTP